MLSGPNMRRLSILDHCVLLYVKESALVIRRIYLAINTAHPTIFASLVDCVFRTW